MKQAPIQPFLLPAALILSGLIIGGAVYYNASQSNKYANSPNTPVPTQTALPTSAPVTQSATPSATATAKATPTATPVSDNTLLRQAVQKKTGIPNSKLVFSVGTISGTVARGTVMNSDDEDGAAWFARKSGGVWTVSYVGQGVPPCADINPWPYPTSWISHCMVGTNVVAR